MGDRQKWPDARHPLRSLGERRLCREQVTTVSRQLHHQGSPALAVSPPAHVVSLCPASPSSEPSQTPLGWGLMLLSPTPHQTANVDSRDNSILWDPRGLAGSGTVGADRKQRRKEDRVSAGGSPHRWSCLWGHRCPDSPRGTRLCSWSWSPGAEAGIGLLR